MFTITLQMALEIGNQKLESIHQVIEERIEAAMAEKETLESEDYLAVWDLLSSAMAKLPEVRRSNEPSGVPVGDLGGLLSDGGDF